MTTSQRSRQQLFLPLTSGVPVGHAKTSATQMRKGRAWTVGEADSFSVLWSLCDKYSRNGWSWRTSRAFSLRTKAPRLSELPTNWKRVGIWGGGWRLTLNMRVYPSIVSGCTLSQVLDRTVPIKSLLTAANCTGILRREKRAGRKLDLVFEKSLKDTIRLWSSVAVASGTPRRVAFAPRYVPKLASIKAATQTGQFSVARNLTWNECERLMGFPAGWTVVEAD